MGMGTKISWILILILVGYIVLIGIRLVKIYINDYHLRGIVKKQTLMFVGSDIDLINKIVKKAKKSNIPIERDDISLIKREKEYAIFRINYSRILDGIFFKHKVNFDYQLEARLY